MLVVESPQPGEYERLLEALGAEDWRPDTRNWQPGSDWETEWQQGAFGLMPKPGGDPPREERRLHPRVSEPPLRMSGLFGIIRDVSQGGFRLETPDPVRVGDRFEVVALDQDALTNVEIETEVVWVRPGAAGFIWRPSSPHQEAWLKGRLRAWGA